MQNAFMETTNITIRHVPKSVRDEYAARAAAKGQSLQQYLLSMLEAHASRPTMEQVLARIREDKAAYPMALDVDDLLADKDADRR